MILRPVSPQSACGPPSSNWPVGFTKISKSSSANCSGQRRPDDVLDQRGPEVVVDADAGVVLRGDEHGVEPLRHAVLVLDRHLRLAVGPEEVDDALLAHLGEALGQPVREPDRHRHERVGLVARVAEHHALVAGADLVVEVAGALRCSIALSTPIAMSGDCSSTETMTPHVLPSMPNAASV